MNSRPTYSPDIISSNSPLLVPLRNKFKHYNIKEIPGWRYADTRGDKQFKLTSSKPYKVKNKNEYYSPLNFALEKRLPFIFPSNMTSQKKSKNNKLGRVLSLKQFKQLREEEEKNARKNKISISYVYEEPEHSGDENLQSLSSCRSLEDCKETRENDRKVINIPDSTKKRVSSQQSETARLVRFAPSFSPDYLLEDRIECLNKSDNDMAESGGRTDQRGGIKLPFAGNSTNYDQNSKNLETADNLLESQQYKNKNLYARGDKILLSADDREQSRKKRMLKDKLNNKKNKEKEIERKDFTEKNIKEGRSRNLVENQDSRKRQGNDLKSRSASRGIKNSVEGALSSENHNIPNSETMNANRGISINNEGALNAENHHIPKAVEFAKRPNNEKNKIIPEGKRQRGDMLGDSLVANNNTTNLRHKLNSSSSNYSSISFSQEHELRRTHKKVRSGSFGTDSEEDSKLSSSQYSLSSDSSSASIEDESISSSEREHKRIERKKSRKLKIKHRNAKKKGRDYIEKKITGYTESNRNYTDKKHSEGIESGEKFLANGIDKRHSLREFMDKDQSSKELLDRSIEEGEEKEEEVEEEVNEIVKKTRGILNNGIVLKINGEIVGKMTPRVRNNMLSNEAEINPPIGVEIKDKDNKSPTDEKNKDLNAIQKGVKKKSTRASTEVPIKSPLHNLLKKNPKYTIKTSNKPPKLTVPNKKKNPYLSNPGKKTTFPSLTLKESNPDVEKPSDRSIALSITITDDPIGSHPINSYNTSGLQGIKEISENTSKERKANYDSNTRLTVKRLTERNESFSSSSRGSSRKLSQKLLEKQNSERKLRESRKKQAKKWIKVGSFKEIDTLVDTQAKDPENLNEIEDDNSDLDMSSELSKYSVIKQIELEQKYLKKAQVGFKEEKKKKSLIGLKILTHFVRQEIKHKLRYTDPVKNFIANFSFSILKCMISLVKQSVLVRRPRRPKQPQKKSKILDAMDTIPLDLAQGKLKVNKRPSELIPAPIKPQPVPQPREKKRSTINPVFYSREIALKTVLSSKNSSPVSKPKASTSIKHKAVVRESDPEGSSDSSFSDSSSSDIFRDPSRDALLYEMTHKDITVQIAKQILRQNSKTLTGEFSIPSPEFPDNTESANEDLEVDLEQEIKEFAGRIGKSVQHFAFSPSINFNFAKKALHTYNFKELEEGHHDIDLENLDNYANKAKFAMHRLSNEYLNNNNDPLRIVSAGEPTEDEKYLQRMKKIKLKLKRQQLHGDKQLLSHFQLDSSSKSSRLVPLSPSSMPARNCFSPKASLFEERVYLRMKNSPSPILKSTFLPN